METIFSWYMEICAFFQPLFPTEFSNSGQVVYIMTTDKNITKR
jgi:hypothetical protein